MKKSTSRKIYELISTLILILLCIIMIGPLIQVISSSISGRNYVEANQIFLIPKAINLEAYQLLLSNSGMIQAFVNSVVITVSGTLLGLVMTATLAYPLSRDEYRGKKIISLMITFTMILTAPLIPQYLLIKGLGLDNTLAAVVLPFAISPFYLFIMRSFFKGIPKSLIESARIDGAGEVTTLVKIVLPMSKASFMSIGMFYAVAHWNALQAPLVYLRDRNLHTLQMKLYDIVMQSNMDMPELSVEKFSPAIIKMSTIVVATLPILLIYPMLQKYFIKGTSLGAIKE